VETLFTYVSKGAFLCSNRMDFPEYSMPSKGASRMVESGMWISLPDVQNWTCTPVHFAKINREELPHRPGCVLLCFSISNNQQHQADITTGVPAMESSGRSLH
jgi:hypothetical protein